jgi:predicted nucleic acid-binding protein
VRWLLDTNVVSETGRDRPSRKVVTWCSQQAEELVAISVVTLAELREGAAIHIDLQRRSEFAEWLDTAVMPWLGERILPVTLEILVDWLDVGRRLSGKGITRNPADLLIAATARVHGLIIVSRNTRDFVGTGVVVYDPWNSETHRMELA